MTTESRMREALEKIESKAEEESGRNEYSTGRANAFEIAADILREALSPPARRTEHEWEFQGERFKVAWGRLFKGLTNEVVYEGWLMWSQSRSGSWMRYGDDFNAAASAIATLAGLTPPEDES